MAESKGTSKSSSSTPKNVIQAPTRAPRRTEEVPVDLEQNYDSSAETKGLGEEGFKKPGDEVVRSTRHQARVDNS